jgi:hypothetical protein
VRAVTHSYEDALDRVWTSAAERIGLHIARSADAYASTDGRGTLTIGTDDTLDADDCLAQMILHELCHSLVQGPDSFERCDWGLDNETERDLSREHACLRLQAYLCSLFGLRRVLAPTTEHRAFYDALSLDPFEGEDASILLARRGAGRTGRDPWAPHLARALEATAKIGAAVAPYAPASSIWSRLEPARAAHRSGFFAHPDPQGRTCGDCAWSRQSKRGKRICAKWSRAIDPDDVACDRHERELDCRTCGACCRDAYSSVEIGAREPFAKKHPELVRRSNGRIALVREHGRCPALEGEGRFTCRVYDDRPRTCRDFEVASANCYEARGRLGLSH